MAIGFFDPSSEMGKTHCPASTADGPAKHRSNGCRWTVKSVLSPLPDIDEMAGDCPGRRHRGRHQMGAALKTLAAFEIAVRGRGAALFRVELVGIHRKAHRAARLAPFEAGLDEDLVEAFGFRLLLHKAGAGHDHGIEVAVDCLAGDYFPRRVQVVDPAVGAGADEDAVELDVGDPGAGCQAHLL